MRVRLAVPAKSYTPSLETTLASVAVAHAFHPMSLEIVVQISSSKALLPRSFETLLEVFAARNVDVFVQFEKDGGVGEALNSAFASRGIVSRARGPLFLTYLGAGDLMCPGSLRILEETHAIYPGASWLTGQISILEPYGVTGIHDANPDFVNLHNFLERNLFIQAEGTFFSAEAFWGVGGFKEGVGLAFDFDLWMRLFKEFPLYFLPTSTGVFSVHEGQLSEDMETYHSEAAHAVDEFFREGRVRDLHDIVFVRKELFSPQSPKSVNRRSG